MIPSSLELNSDDFPFFGDLKRTSGSREKLEKSSFENRDNHHWPGGSEMSRWWWWWWWWWLEKIRKTKIQTQRQIQRQIHTHKYRKIPNTQSQKDQNAKSQMSCCHADFVFFSSQVTTWLFAIILTLTEVEISFRTYNSGAVNYHFLLPLNLSF